jgi:hypothetical protein
MVKINTALFLTRQSYAPFDVVAWHGNYYPVEYDLGRVVLPAVSLTTTRSLRIRRHLGYGTAVGGFVTSPHAGSSLRGRSAWLGITVLR